MTHTYPLRRSSATGPPRSFHTVRDGSMHATGQCTLTNIETVAQFEAIEPRTIAIIAIFSSVEFYRP
jgi:hypothetical protein